MEKYFDSCLRVGLAHNKFSILISGLLEELVVEHVDGGTQSGREGDIVLAHSLVAGGRPHEQIVLVLSILLEIGRTFVLDYFYQGLY